MKTKEELLIKACRIGALDLVKLLVEGSADFRKMSNDPLWHAIRRNQLPVVRYLVDTERYKHSNVPINIAVALGNVEVVKYLEEKGVDIRKEGFFLEAARRGHLPLVSYLLRNVKDIHLINSAIQLARSTSRFSPVADYLEALKMSRKECKITQGVRYNRNEIGYEIWKEL